MAFHGLVLPASVGFGFGGHQRPSGRSIYSSRGRASFRLTQSRPERVVENAVYALFRQSASVRGMPSIEHVSPAGSGPSLSVAHVTLSQFHMFS